MPTTLTQAPQPTASAHPARTDNPSSARSECSQEHSDENAKHQAGNSEHQTRNLPPIQNRVPVLLVHIPKLSIRGQARLAAEVGVSRSTVSRLVNGRINPSYRLARGVTDALERFLGRPLDMRDVFSTDGTYLTPSGCALCKCGGCLPKAAWGDDGTLKPEWRDARPGDWSVARPADTLVPTEFGTHVESVAGAGKGGE